MKVALIIGHNSRSEGAYSKVLGSEYAYWKLIAERIKERIPNLVDVYKRRPKQAYTQEMNEVLNELNKKNYSFCLELHFNSAISKTAKGCECLVFYKNKNAQKLATKFMNKLNIKYSSNIRKKENFIETKNIDKNGKLEIKKIITDGLILVQTSNIRGAYGICNSKDTYILLEPFFGSNDEEALKFSIIPDIVELFINFIKENIGG